MNVYKCQKCGAESTNSARCPDKECDGRMRSK